MNSQREVGIVPVAITAPFQRPQAASCRVEEIEGIRYYRTYNENAQQAVAEGTRPLVHRLNKLLQMPRFYRDVANVAAREDVDVVHGHGTFFCGNAAAYAGRALSIPSIYEVRSLWEERNRYAASGRIERAREKLISRLIRRIETRAMQQVSAVVSINEALTRDILARGVARAKVTTIGNAIHVRGHPPPIRPWARRPVLGYVGNLSPIEGLDHLLTASNLLEKQGLIGGLVIAGGGKQQAELERQASQLGSHVLFTGRFSPRDAPSIYERIDIVVNPRMRSVLTESVTPIKPLEAMYYGKLVVASDVGGMRELIQDNVTGLLYRANSVSDLGERILWAIKTPADIIQKIRRNGQAYIENERSWKTNAVAYANLYRTLTGAHGAKDNDTRG